MEKRSQKNKRIINSYKSKFYFVIYSFNEKVTIRVVYLKMELRQRRMNAEDHVML